MYQGVALENQNQLVDILNNTISNTILANGEKLKSNILSLLRSALNIGWQKQNR